MKWVLLTSYSNIKLAQKSILLKDTTPHKAPSFLKPPCIEIIAIRQLPLNNIEYISSNRDYYDSSPSLSADGKLLTFVRKCKADKKTSLLDYNHEIFVADLSQGSLTNFSNNVFQDTDPSISPDGK